jgi:Ni/Fe-hydrogenase 1 B-type cytochrome subunit
MSHAEYKESHPLLQRIIHWVHLISMIVLAFTGFYIHNPFFDWNMGLARWLHFVFMYIVLIAFAMRIYFALFGRSAIARGTRETFLDGKNFLPQQENRGQTVETVKYYLFLRKTHPRTGKYNPLQKSTYGVMAVLLILQALTGFALYTPFLGYFDWVTSALGGLMVVRQVHYLIMWIFIVLTGVHIYLSFAEGARTVPLMFVGKESVPSDE